MGCGRKGSGLNETRHTLHHLAFTIHGKENTKAKVQRLLVRDNSWILQMLKYKDPWSEINSWILHMGFDRSMHDRGGKWADHIQLLYSLSPAVQFLHSVVPLYLHPTHYVISDIALRG